LKQPRLHNNAPTWSWISVQSPVHHPRARSAWNEMFVAKIQLDELNTSAINVHGCLLELTPSKSENHWFNMPTTSLVTGKPTSTSVEWDTIDNGFAKLFFVPVLSTKPTGRGGVAQWALCSSRRRRTAYIPTMWVCNHQDTDGLPWHD
jgi:hypothetical protein